MPRHPSAAFGLTVIEAMTCGLPTFATNHGGPSEIIKHKKSGGRAGEGQREEQEARGFPCTRTCWHLPNAGPCLQLCPTPLPASQTAP